MPNYKYKCEMCEHEEIYFLPISSDPAKVLPCPVCSLNMMSRKVIGKNSFNVKESFGKWYKRKTGKDLMGGE